MSTHQLTFTAADTCAPVSPQMVTATVTGPGAGRSLYIRIVSTGPAVSSISDVTIVNSTTGQALVYPASALALGPGTFFSTITVSACTTDPDCSSVQLPGSPQTVNVTYEIGGPGVMDDPSAYSITRWETRTSNAPFLADFRLAAIGDALYAVALGFYSHVVETWLSTDAGATWSQVAGSGPTTSVKDFALASDDQAIYLSGGVDASGAATNQVWRFDGRNWTLKAANPGFAARARHAMIRRGGSLFVLGGRSGTALLGDVWVSNDNGETWASLATSAFTPRADLCAVAFSDSLYVLGGEGADVASADVWRSLDGTAWATLPLPPRSPFVSATSQPSGRCAAVGGRMYYVSGAFNSPCQAASVSSTDGTNWQFEASSFSPFPAPGSAIIKGQIYLASGAGTSQRFVVRSVP